MSGILTISLDFELYWGIRDRRNISEYEERLEGVRRAVGRILDLFDEYEIHATWAVVGFLFAKDIEDLKSICPKIRPGYHNPILDPYRYIFNANVLQSHCHFAPDLIDEICAHQHQEIGSHTLSHYYCLEDGQTVEQFSSDIEMAIDVAKKRYRDKNYSIS